jgi:hypothetical protein
VRPTPALAALTLTAALTTTLTTATVAAGSADAAGAAHAASGTLRHRSGTTGDKGGVGSWTKISRNTVGIIYQASMTRTSNGVLHIVYPHDPSGGGTTLGHTALNTDGSVVRQNDVLVDGWSTMDSTPVVVDGAGGLHTVFAGIHDLGAGFFDDGRMYLADATDDTGASWTLPSQAVGLSHSAYGTYGTGAVELADGTPVAAWPLNNTLTWHVGTGAGADQTYTSPQCCLYDVTLVRDGSTVWAGWYQNGSTSGTNGFFALQIYPSVGSVQKAPGSSVGTDSIPWLTRTAMAARVGGGAYLAYCVGYPTCDKVRIWKLGTATTADVPSSRYATAIGLSSGPSGRLWVAWSDNIPRVRAVRTGSNGLAMGAVRTLGHPSGHPSVYNLVIEGSRARGDVVVNVGDGFWHTQVLAGLTLHASPSGWRHGQRQRVVFSVSDAHAGVGGATVKVGTASCHTSGAGTCAITFPASFGKGRHTASASRSGYAKATTTLRVS